MGAVEQQDSHSCTKQGVALYFVLCAGLNNGAGLYLCYCSNAHSYPKFHITFLLKLTSQFEMHLAPPNLKNYLKSLPILQLHDERNNKLDYFF